MIAVRNFTFGCTGKAKDAIKCAFRKSETYLIQSFYPGNRKSKSQPI